MPYFVIKQFLTSESDLIWIKKKGIISLCYTTFSKAAKPIYTLRNFLRASSKNNFPPPYYLTTHHRIPTEIHYGCKHSFWRLVLLIAELTYRAGSNCYATQIFFASKKTFKKIMWKISFHYNFPEKVLSYISFRQLISF